jgi:hypothetical protein
MAEAVRDKEEMKRVLEETKEAVKRLPEYYPLGPTSSIVNLEARAVCHPHS